MEGESIDDSLYSRQRYMLGDHAMHKINRSSVFLSGLGGIGVEIAKNVVLAGVKAITLHDTKAATYLDLGSNFFLHEEDVTQKKNRAVASSGSISELNPYVDIKTDTKVIDENDLDFLKQHQCVILTDCLLSLQVKVNAFCRSQSPPIQFISTNVFGVFASLFCDFGPEFEVLDTWTEEPKSFFIGNMTKSNPGVVTTLDNMYHGLQKGDKVVFKELVGMEILNDSEQVVGQVLSPHSFTICDTSDSNFTPYMYGGTASMVKPGSTHLSFQCLEDQLKTPDIVIADFMKTNVPIQLHAGMHAVNLFWEKNGRLPQVRDCKDAEEVLKIASDSCHGEINSDIVRALSYVSQGCFAPLAAAMGGIAAQEVLKALTAKFNPLRQWLYLDVSEILNKRENEDVSNFFPRSDRYDALRICTGNKVLDKLNDLNLFMVGCGAIGCELLKNFALLGVSTGQKALLTITDNDLIEKSNLNRQFLFRQHHIQKPKSTTAAKSAQHINPKIQIDPLVERVCPDTEKTLFHDEFFTSQDVVINALDNVAARRYIDSRCVHNQKGLIETGTMGAKGHVQVIVPFLTENYSSQRDPEDDDVPYCTLKSFPSIIEHTIQWARDKFENSFIHKMEIFKQFWAQYKTPQNALQSIESMQNLEALLVVTKMLKNQPKSWRDCVAFARNKFEKYFSHKAQNLLRAFPLDITLKDGTPFWKSPKRPPTPLEFDINNDLHRMFIVSASRLYADVHMIQYTQKDLSSEALSRALSTVEVVRFSPSGKEILTDEKKGKPSKDLKSGDHIEVCREALARLDATTPDIGFERKVVPLRFEKDDDSNGHIDFITAAANLRAQMYSIETVDRLKVKRIAGKIIPAIATTTAAVAGLACIELVKYAIQSTLSDYRNSFINLALPYVIFAEPGAVQKTLIKKGLSYTIWDHWTVYGHKNFTLQDFINWFKDHHGLDVSMVVQGVRMVYIPIMPGHNKRLHQSMVKLLKLNQTQKSADLTVSFAALNYDEDDIAGPPIRYIIDEL